MASLFNEAVKVHSGDASTKPLSYYKRYDLFMDHHGLIPQTILEIGTFEGESTKVLSRTFQHAKILSVDLNIKEINFSDFKNVAYEKADQTNSKQLNALIAKYFPQGVDLVIEDASHIGHYSSLTFDIVFPFLNHGGAYFIEDWGTGYWDSWPDGSRFQSFNHSCLDEKNIPKRIPSHDFGMVGFVKSLVDLIHKSAIKNNQHEHAANSSPLRALEFGEGICMALKA